MNAPPEQPQHRTRLRFPRTREELGTSPLVKGTMGLILLVAITAMFPHGETVEFSASVGTIWPDNDLVAPFSFAVLRDVHVYEKERQEAAKEIYPVFSRDELLEQTEADSLATVLSVLGKLIGTPAKARSGARDTAWLGAVRAAMPFALTEKSVPALSALRGSRGAFQKFELAVRGGLYDVLRNGVMNQHKIHSARGAIALRKGSSETIIPVDRLTNYDSALELLEKRFNETFRGDSMVDLAMSILRSVLRPNLLLNEEETAKAILAAEENVPRTSGFVRERETIVSRNEVITPELKARLDSFQRARRERGIESQEVRHFIGIVLHLFLILALFSIYLFLFRPKIFNDNIQLSIIALLILMVTMLAYVSVVVPVAAPLQYLILVPAASMLLAIIFDSRVAFYGTVTMALLIGAMRGNDYGIGLISLVGGALGAYTVRDIIHRTQIFRSLIFIFIGYAFSIIALSVERFEPGSTILFSLTFALANAVISPVLTYGLLILFERVFNVTTDLRLVELSDLSNPLLQELSEKAPGTFHHSVTIGTLGEAAAEAVGANAILAKVGGYYHDIGKLQKPEYFVENQVIGQNRHNRLKPRMSALIISSHVKDGMELARERGLPESIVDFIPQHHGTNRISFFYDKALRQATKRPTKETINESDFRYPGPKPQSKETGIIMLADSVEASTRAIKEMTPQSLERAIDNMIKHRFLEGQLEDCELTLRDLTNIKEAFLRILAGIHHQRIKYPEQEAAEQIAQAPVPAPVEAVEVPAVRPEEIPLPAPEPAPVQPEEEPPPAGETGPTGTPVSPA